MPTGRCLIKITLTPPGIQRRAPAAVPTTISLWWARATCRSTQTCHGSHSPRARQDPTTKIGDKWAEGRPTTACLGVGVRRRGVKSRDNAGATPMENFRCRSSQPRMFWKKGMSWIIIVIQALSKDSLYLYDSKPFLGLIGNKTFWIELKFPTWIDLTFFRIYPK